ncbi:hypothetical protein LCGC14_2575390, partial [marine sediment metagenome]
MGGYNHRFFWRHYVQARDWEKKVGSNIVETLEIESILDLGCGIGSFLEGAYESGCNNLVGIELHIDRADRYIEEKMKPYIHYGDITIPLELEKTFDCCISVEVAEHILPEKSKQFLDNLTKYTDKYIIMTAAPPGQRGTQHFNLQEKSYWIERIKKRGFIHQKELVDKYTKLWENFAIPD